MLKSIGKSLMRVQQKCVKKQKSDEVDKSVSVHGDEDEDVVVLAVQCCNCSTEENKQCNCDHVHAADDQNHANSNSSFTHSVINMVGMLIGKFIILLPFFL